VTNKQFQEYLLSVGYIQNLTKFEKTYNKNMRITVRFNKRSTTIKIKAMQMVVYSHSYELDYLNEQYFKTLIRPYVSTLRNIYINF
jgi:hypothetical protein